MERFEIPEKYQSLYNDFKLLMTSEAFDTWCEIVTGNTQSYPQEILKTKTNNVKDLTQEAREAVAGYAATNGLRRAVEKLAEALEGN